ncbi:MAG: hypothetical protein F6K30_21750 [Cyanothece sp. SIO2G6]|nr:hypothetical protein [Cyanothece sp. SIO2G6]
MISVSQTDIDHVQQIIAPLLGQKAWGVSLGVGSSLTTEFGAPILDEPNAKKQHGEWHLWTYFCVWRLERQNRILVGAEDSWDRIASAIRHLENKSLKSVELFAPAWDSIFHFEDDILLRSFSIITFEEDAEHWKLFTPNGKVILLGPGSS